MQKEKWFVLTAFFSGELQFGNIYVKFEGSIDFLEGQQYTLGGNTKF
jgi:hypothetical protein